MPGRPFFLISNGARSVCWHDEERWPLMHVSLRCRKPRARRREQCAHQAYFLSLTKIMPGHRSTTQQRSSSQKDGTLPIPRGCALSGPNPEGIPTNRDRSRIRLRHPSLHLASPHARINSLLRPCSPCSSRSPLLQPIFSLWKLVNLLLTEHARVPI